MSAPKSNAPFDVLRSGPFEHQLTVVDVGGVAMLRHKQSGVLFLRHHGAFRAGQVYSYDGRGENVSVRYTAGASAIVTIYVMPFRSPRTAAEFDGVFNASVVDMMANVPEPHRADQRRVAFARAAEGLVLGRRVELSGAACSGSIRVDHSVIELFALQRWLLKIRASCRASLRAELEVFLCAWLAASESAQA